MAWVPDENLALMGFDPSEVRARVKGSKTDLFGPNDLGPEVMACRTDLGLDRSGNLAIKGECRKRDGTGIYASITLAEPRPTSYSAYIRRSGGPAE